VKHGFAQMYSERNVGIIFPIAFKTLYRNQLQKKFNFVGTKSKELNFIKDIYNNKALYMNKFKHNTTYTFKKLSKIYIFKKHERLPFYKNSISKYVSVLI